MSDIDPKAYEALADAAYDSLIEEPRISREHLRQLIEAYTALRDATRRRKCGEDVAASPANEPGPAGVDVTLQFLRDAEKRVTDIYPSAFNAGWGYGRARDSSGMSSTEYSKAAHKTEAACLSNIREVRKGVAALLDELERARAERDAERSYKGRLRGECVRTLTDVGIAMLGDGHDPTAPGEVASAIRRIASERDTLARELAGLREALPRTADGVTIVPGMTVYRLSQSGGVGVHEVHAVKAEHWVDDNLVHFGPRSPIYSTREAAIPALAAKQEEAK